ncbi:Alkyl hydroperoxide reductase protein C [Clostridiaceae bacterium JG1575]|nr:Alkyl hydroperoxide reductase protein C [Clostridiaceae bacterium JG1575]
MGVQILAVSTDSIFTHKVWSEQEISKMNKSGVPFPMLTDKGGEMGKAYGVYDEDGGVDFRGSFIIDPDGIVQAFEVLTPSVGRNPREAIRQIQALQKVRESEGKEACPSNWTPEKKTLTPSPDLVGNVWKEWSVEDNK